MAINTQKVIVGGLVAGIVVGVIDFVVNGILLADMNEAAMNALNPDLMANMEGTGFIVMMVVGNLGFGILMAFTYAAMRPRFGEGSKTAVMAGLQIWGFMLLISLFMTMSGMFGWNLFAIGAVVGLVELQVGTHVAGYLYSE